MPYAICLKYLNLNQNVLLPSFIIISKHPSTRITPKLLVMVVDINLILILAQKLVQNIMTNTPPIIILHTMIVTDLAMISIIENVLHEHFILSGCYHSPSSRSPYNYCHRSRECSSSYNNSSFRRYTSPYRSPSKPRLIVIEVDHTQIQNTPLITIKNPLLFLFNNPPHYFTTLPLQNLRSKLICITQTPPLVHNTPHLQIFMLTLSRCIRF